MGRSSVALCLTCLQVVFVVSAQPLASTDTSQEQLKKEGCFAPAAYVGALKPADASLKYLFGIFRHGIRTSVAHPLYGRLTQIGKRQMYYLGKTLRARYSKFIKEYDEGKVVFSATASARTAMSALSVAAGLFPPSSDIVPGLHWQPVPVDQRTKDMDRSYVFSGSFPQSALQVCPSFGKLIQKGYETNIKPDLKPEHKQFYELLQRYDANSNITSLRDVYLVWDRLHTQCQNGKSPPAWATESRPELNNETLYPGFLRQLIQEFSENLQYFENNKDMLNFLSGPIFHVINTRFAAVPGTLSFHSTHDVTLNALLWSLGLDELVMAEPGDGLLFELHQEGNSSTVKIFHHGTNHDHFLKEVVLPLCPPPCSRGDFAVKFAGVTPEQWSEKCKLY